jgi:hypothetical protein
VDRTEAKLPGISSAIIEGADGAEDAERADGASSDDAFTSAAEQFSALAAQREPATQPQIGNGIFPPEIEQHIMSMMHPQDLNRFAQTNSHYRALAEDNPALKTTSKRARAANFKIADLQGKGYLDRGNEAFVVSYHEIGPDFPYIDEQQANDLIKAVGGPDEQDQSAAMTEQDQSAAVTEQDQSAAVTERDQSTAMTEKDRAAAITGATKYWHHLTEPQRDAFFNAAMTLKTPELQKNALETIGDSLRQLTPTQQARWVGAVVGLPQYERLGVVIGARINLKNLSQDDGKALLESISELPDSLPKDMALVILRARTQIEYD